MNLFLGLGSGKNEGGSELWGGILGRGGGLALSPFRVRLGGFAVSECTGTLGAWEGTCRTGLGAGCSACRPVPIPSTTSCPFFLLGAWDFANTLQHQGPWKGRAGCYSRDHSSAVCARYRRGTARAGPARVPLLVLFLFLLGLLIVDLFLSFTWGHGRMADGQWDNGNKPPPPTQSWPFFNLLPRTPDLTTQQLPQPQTRWGGRGGIGKEGVTAPGCRAAWWCGGGCGGHARAWMALNLCLAPAPPLFPPWLANRMFPRMVGRMRAAK